MRDFGDTAPTQVWMSNALYKALQAELEPALLKIDTAMTTRTVAGMLIVVADGATGLAVCGIPKGGSGIPKEGEWLYL